MKLVVIESPYAGDIEKNEEFARKCMRHSIKKGEIPIASHLLYTQPHILDEHNPIERNLGISMGYYWGIHADLVVFYMDNGMSSGMQATLDYYTRVGIKTEKRYLSGAAFKIKN